MFQPSSPYERISGLSEESVVELLTKELPSVAVQSKDRFELWVAIATVIHASHVAEVGVWRGAFAEYLLRGLPSLTSYTFIDPWRQLTDWNKPLNVDQNQHELAMQMALQATAFAASKVNVLRGTTAEVSGEIADESQDLIYVDGDHTLRGITLDLTLMLAKVRPGGLLGGDDYVDNPWHHGASYEPTLVAPFARYFAEAHRLPFFELPHAQFLIVNEPIGFSATNLSGRPGIDVVSAPSRLMKLRQLGGYMRRRLTSPNSGG
jgi:predicted O-methyltransferase YrrM